jgi:hypothetical protein
MLARILVQMRRMMMMMMMMMMELLLDEASEVVYIYLTSTRHP